MKILKTKVEKQQEAEVNSKATIEEITKKIEEAGKVTVEFDREDFKDELSTGFGFGFQDLKKENRIVITELIKTYDAKFFPILDGESGFGVSVTFKKK